MTWLVLRYWYGYHRSKFQKWDGRKHRWDEKRGWKIYANGARRRARIQRKHEWHGFWFDHYCQLMSAYGHKIECIHFGKGENTIQSGQCPYREDECARCDGRVHLHRGAWRHYLSQYSDHDPVPKLGHWPVSLQKGKA